MGAPARRGQPVPAWRARERAERRRDVVRAAREVFGALGYDGATVSAIAARADVSRGSLYALFPGGKRAVYRTATGSIAAGETDPGGFGGPERLR